MRFVGTEVEGAFLVEPEPHTDERAYFARTFCEEEFADLGLTGATTQVNPCERHDG